MDAAPELATCRVPEQDMEAALDASSLVRTGSGVGLAEAAAAQPPRSIPARAAQFGEAQRIILLDVARADYGAHLGPDAEHVNGAVNGAHPLSCPTLTPAVLAIPGTLIIPAACHATVTCLSGSLAAMMVSCARGAAQPASCCAGPASL